MELQSQRPYSESWNPCRERAKPGSTSLKTNAKSKELSKLWMRAVHSKHLLNNPLPLLAEGKTASPVSKASNTYI